MHYSQIRMNAMSRLRVLAVTATLMLAFAVGRAHAQNPALSFVDAFSGASTASPIAVATDAIGNIYVTGLFRGTVDFDPGAGTANLTCAGTAGTLDADAFVASYDASGTYRWAFRLGGHPADFDSENQGTAIAINGTGDVIVSGMFAGTADFDPGPGTSNLTVVGGVWPNIFVARYTSAGSYVSAFTVHAQWSSLAIAPGGDVILTGRFIGTVDLDPGPGTASFTSSRFDRKNNMDDNTDVFVGRYSPSGAFRWAFKLGNEWGETADIGIDASGTIYLSGAFSGTIDFDPGKNRTLLAGPGTYLARYTGAGAFVSAMKLYSAPVQSSGLAVDASGNVVVAGKFTGTVDFDPGAGTASLTGIATGSNTDMFVARYTALGTYQWVFSPGIGNANVPAIEAGSGDVVLTGTFNGTNDFDPGSGVTSLVGNTSGRGGFIARYSSAGGNRWAFALSSTSGNGNPRRVGTDAAGDAVVIGGFNGMVAFDPAGTTQLESTVTSTGTYRTDGFVAKYTEQMLPKRSAGALGTDEILLR